MSSRAALAAPLLLQAPPGQLSNVYDDLIGLVKSEDEASREDEEEFKNLAIQAREQHNLEQHIIVDLPQGLGKGIICPSAVHVSGKGRFLAPRQQISYLVDHESLSTADAHKYKVNAQVESFRSLLEKYLSVYIQDRYSSGLVEVFAIPLPRKEIIVAKDVEQEAAEILTDVDPALEAASVSTGAEAAVVAITEEATKRPEADIVASEGERMDMDDAEEQIKKIEAEDNATDEVKDDPVETAIAMEEVEADAKNSSAAATIEEAKEEVDEETEGDTKLVIHIVANKYKLSNFWSGRWRSTYILDDSASSEVKASIRVQVHYFEEGNVQLNSNKDETLAISMDSSEEARAKAVTRAIETFEGKYQEELYHTCSELSEGAFKSLRRQLPMTKQKVDWDKVLNYKLGSELAE